MDAMTRDVFPKEIKRHIELAESLLKKYYAACSTEEEKIQAMNLISECNVKLTTSNITNG